MVQRAHDIVVDVRENYHPEPIPEDVLRVMEGIVERADAAYR